RWSATHDLVAGLDAVNVRESQAFLPRSRMRFNRNSAFDLASTTDVIDISRQGIQRHARNVGIGLDFRFKGAGRVTDRGVRHAHSPIQPRPASEAPNDRD